MKRLSFFLLFLAGFVLFFSSCHREKKDSAMEKFTELTWQYVTEDLQIQGVDSVCVVRVDTVDNYEYALIMVDLLHQMDAETLYEYQAALTAGDDAVAKELELQMDEVAAAGEQWDMEVAANENAPKSMKFYLLTANYYAGKDIDQFYFFVTPDFKIHISDPFEEL